MQIKRLPDGAYALTCDEGELSLIAEGLYAVEDAGRRCLANDVPDEFDRPVLEVEVRRLGRMRLAIEGVLDISPAFRAIEGGRG